MKPFIFKLDHRNLYTFLYSSSESMVEKNWPGLAREWEQEETPYTEFNINNTNREEVGIYLGLAWRLSAGLSRFAIPKYYKESAARLMDQIYERVQWEYEVVARNGIIEDKGFVPAKSYFSLSNQEAKLTNEAGLFNIKTFSSLVALQRATLSDAFSEINLYCLRPDGHARLLAALQSKERPEPQHFLKEGELLIDITIGIDVGRQDAVLIKSVSDVSRNLKELTSEYEKLIYNYESTVDRIEDVKAILPLLRNLIWGRELSPPLHSEN